MMRILDPMPRLDYAVRDKLKELDVNKFIK